MNRKRPKNGQSRAQKLSLNSILKEDFREAFTGRVASWCETATIISVLASLLFLYKNNKAFDDGDQRFFEGNGDQVISDCFNSILNANKHRLPFEFRQWVESTVPNFQWPALDALHNAFNYIVTQYTTNVKNNLKIWCYSRIKTFFKLRRHQMNLMDDQLNITDIDVTNATKAVLFNNVIPTENVNMLLHQARMIGIPVGQKLCDVVRYRWFETIPIFLNIQRAVFEYHEHYSILNELWRKYHQDPVNNRKPTVPRPPKINNFRVIPVHDFKMKHIRIDISQFFKMVKPMGVMKGGVGVRGFKIDIHESDYKKDPSTYWDRVFDMKKIVRIGGKKEFDFGIVTDSVDVSLCYVKPERETIEYTDGDINFMYERGDFVFVLGMDPGVRTWNATVRKHIQSGVEV